MEHLNTKSASEVQNHLGNLVRDRRKALGISQGALAEILGLETEAMIVKIEKGSKELPAKHISKLCKVLKIRKSTLIGLKVRAFRHELIEEVKKCS